MSDREGNCHNLYGPCNNFCCCISASAEIYFKEEKGVKVFGLVSRMVMFSEKNAFFLGISFFKFKKFIFERLTIYKNKNKKHNGGFECIY